MKTSILIVDDDESVLAGLAANLEDAGYDACPAASGADALRLMEERPVDLVLADLVMDGIDGMELLRRICGRRPRIPVIVITGHGTPANAVEALREGAADFIQKPARPDEIARRVRDVLDVHRLQRRLVVERDQSRRRDLHSDARREREHRMVALRRYSKGLGGLIRCTADDLQRAVPKLLARLRDDPELQKSAEAVAAAANHADALLRRLYQVSAGERAGTERVDLNALIQQVFFAPRNAHRGRISNAAHRMAFHPAPIAPVTFGSPLRIERALRILVENAMDGLGAESGIDIRTFLRPCSDMTVHYGPVPTGPCAGVVVREPRPIPLEYADAAFEPFFVDTVMGRTGNDGFGLTVAHAIAQAHGGCVGISCERDATEWMLMLPAELKTVEAAGDNGDGGIPRGRHVLVVDDQSAYRDHAARMLRDLGCRVTMAETASCAIDLVSRAASGELPPLDAVLLDLILGDAMDGVDVLHQIRRVQADLRVVLVGGFTETDRVAHARTLGISDYLRKPLTPETLVRALRG